MLLQLRDVACRNICKIVFKRLHGNRPRNRWEDSIVTDLREVGHEEVELTQDGHKDGILRALAESNTQECTGILGTGFCF
jgi:hypothetical protein